MSVVRIVVCCALLGTAPAFAQSWEYPQPGSAIIRGHVTAAGSLQPLARAEVVLEGQTRDNAVFADEQGWFEFRGLPAGRYTVRAARAGYLTTHYGQVDPAGAAQSIEIADADVRASIDVRLPRAGVIAVTVVDEFGAPVEGAFVQAQTARIARGLLELGYTTSARQNTHASDDRGRIRLFDLPPGEYYVSASLPALPRRISDNDRRRNVSRLQTFHPATVWLNEAAPVVLELGQEVGLTLAIVPTRVALVSGQVIREDGTVLRPYSLAMKRLVKGQFHEPLRHPRMTGNDFEFADLPPGQYRIEYHSDPSDTSTNDAGALDVTVGGFDLTGVVVTAKPAALIKGRLVPDQGKGPSEWNDALFRPTLKLENGETHTLRPGPDGTFAIAGLTGRVTGWGGEGWTWVLKAVMRGGRDVTDQPIDLTSGTVIDDIRVVVTQDEQKR